MFYRKHCRSNFGFLNSERVLCENCQEEIIPPEEKGKEGKDDQKFRSRSKLSKANLEDLEKLRKLNKTMRTKFLDSTKCMVQFQFLSSALKHLRSQTTIRGVAQCVKDVRNFLMCKDTSLWLFDPFIQKVFAKEGGKGEVSVVDGTHIERAVIETTTGKSS